MPAIVGFGRAAELCREHAASEAPRLRALRDRLWNGLTRHVDDVFLNGAMQARLPQNLNVRVEGVHGEMLLKVARE